MKWPLRWGLSRATAIASACSLVLLLGISVAALRGLANVATVRDGLARAQQARLQINELQAIVDSEQHAQRSFMLTGEEVAVETGRSAARRFAGLLQEVRVNTRDVPNVQQEADRVARLFEQRQAWSAETIRVYREQGQLAAVRLIQFGPNMVRFETVREHIGAINTGLDDWLHDLLIQASGVAKWLFLLIPLACLIGGLTLAMFLFSLNREASLRRRTEYQLAEEKRLALATVDALSEHIAIINSRGVIIAVNAAWRRFELTHPGAGRHGLPGQSCLQTDAPAAGAVNVSHEDARIHAAMRAVLSDQVEKAELEYAIGSPQDGHWFALCVTRFKGDAKVAAVVSQVDISTRKRVELELARKLAELQSEMTERTLAQTRAEAASTELVRREGELRLAGVVDAAMDAIISVDAGFQIVQFNRTAESMFGRKRADMLGQTLDCLLPGGMQATHSRHMQGFRETSITSRVMGKDRILRGVRADGEDFPIEASSISQFGVGEAKVFTVILRDVTERLRSDEKLQRAAIVFNQAHDGIMITDADGVIQEVNEAFTQLFGFGRDEIVGRRHDVLQSSENSPGLHAALWDAIQTDGRWTGEIWSQRSNGESFSSMLDVVSVRDPGGVVQNLVAVYTDMTPFKEHQEQLQYTAHHDALTGLPNRALLEEFVRQEIATAQRRGDFLAMMLIGIDHFKDISKTFGHHAADTLQVQLGRELVAAFRKQDTVGFVAGQGFVVVLPDTDSDGAARLANKLLERNAQPYRIDEQEIFVTFSIGIAISPVDAQDYDGLARCLIAATQRARLAGDGNFQFFDPAMQRQEQEDLQIATALRLAIERAELRLHYQPLVDLQTGRVGGLEALLRWQHPELGAVSPARFIPVAESNGLIRPIGQWVLRQACQDIRNWLDRGIDVPPIAVNVSPLQFRDADLVTRLQATLKEFGIEGWRICVELTEGLLMVDIARSEAMLRAIKALGVKLSLDDFGTGYSSLSYLKLFPIDKVKIDKSFVRNLPENFEDAEIARVVVSMAHGLGMRVVAEGVETEAQCRFLRDNVCDEIQGYLFSRPLPFEQIELLLREDRRLPAALMRVQEKSRTILLVDDEPNVIASLKRLLRADGYRILSASSGPQGLETLEHDSIDIIVSDQRMPGMTGLEFLRIAKRLHPQTVRIVLSGHTELDSVTAAINEGAVYRFMTKPWDDQQFRRFILEAFVHKDLMDENRRLDLKLRSSNQELAASNRHLRELVGDKARLLTHTEISVNLIRETLHKLPLPVIGLDDANMVAFSNEAADLLLQEHGLYVGADASQVIPEFIGKLSVTAEAQAVLLRIGGRAYRVAWRRMGQSSDSSGRFVTFDYVT